MHAHAPAFHLLEAMVWTPTSSWASKQRDQSRHASLLSSTDGLDDVCECAWSTREVPVFLLLHSLPISSVAS